MIGPVGPGLAAVVSTTPQWWSFQERDPVSTYERGLRLSVAERDSPRTPGLPTHIPPCRYSARDRQGIHASVHRAAFSFGLQALAIRTWFWVALHGESPTSESTQETPGTGCCEGLEGYCCWLLGGGGGKGYTTLLCYT